MDNYIYILNVRFSGDIHYERKVDKKLLSVQIPSMILQPIVENAILHNVSSGHLLKILIQGTIEDGNVVFHITDNGSGMSRDQIHHILTTAPKERNHVFRGIGVFNVNERLRLLYGDTYGVSFDSQVGHYTKATIIFPIQTNTGEPKIC